VDGISGIISIEILSVFFGVYRQTRLDVGSELKNLAVEKRESSAVKRRPSLVVEALQAFSGSSFVFLSSSIKVLS